jgi:hypothetical protein
MANRDASHERAAWRAAANLRTGRVHAAAHSPSICAYITDLLVAAALDVALAADEATVDAHADSCRRCAAVLAELRHVAAGLGAAVPQIEPPAPLGGQLINRALRDRAMPPARGQESTPEGAANADH